MFARFYLLKGSSGLFPGGYSVSWFPYHLSPGLARLYLLLGSYHLSPSLARLDLLRGSYHLSPGLARFYHLVCLLVGLGSSFSWVLLICLLVFLSSPGFLLSVTWFG